ncbi:MAG: nucleotidyltransferase family protein [Fervidicoccus fontis]
MKVETAAILAGGYGKRLRPLTDSIPKPMIEVGGRPILEWQMLWLRSLGIKKFVLLVGYLGEIIKSYFGNGEKLKVEIKYSFENEPLGTGGAIKNAYNVMKDEKYFFVVNGDIITNLNPYEMVSDLEDEIGVIALAPLQSQYGVVDVDSNDHIRGFREKPKIEGIWINAGVYLLKSEIFEMLPKKGDIEKETFPKVAEQNKLKGKKYFDIYWKSIDSHKDLEEVDKAIREKKVFSF